MEGFAATPGERGLNRPASDAPPLFHPIQKRPDCPYCAGTAPVPDLAGLIDAVYCISLQEQPHRTAQATALFHQFGLCRAVVFFRPTRPHGRDESWGVWDSHRRVARHALAAGHARVLIFEDDVRLIRPWPEIAAEIERAFRELPEDWWGLFLGHFPLQAYFVTARLLRVRSVCAHAYIANRPLLRWLGETDPDDREVPVSRIVGRAMDGAFTKLPNMYALFPMQATQRAMGETGRRRSRDLLIFHGMKPAESIAVLLSPLHRLTMSLRRSRGAGRK